MWQGLVTRGYSKRNCEGSRGRSSTFLREFQEQSDSPEHAWSLSIIYPCREEHFLRLYFVFCKKLGISSDVNKEVSGTSNPEENTCNECSSINIKIIFIFTKYVQKFAPQWCPGVPR